MYKGKLHQENENEEQVGNILIKENYEENVLDKLSIEQLENDDFELHKEYGGNYTSWEFRLLNILEYKECKDQAIRVRDATKAG